MGPNIKLSKTVYTLTPLIRTNRTWKVSFGSWFSIMFFHVFYFFNSNDFLKLVRIDPDRYLKFLRPSLVYLLKIFRKTTLCGIIFGNQTRQRCFINYYLIALWQLQPRIQISRRMRSHEDLLWRIRWDLIVQ